MKRVFISLLVSVSALVSISASATEIVSGSGWQDEYAQAQKRVYVEYISSSEDDGKFFEMSVSHSDAGEQRIYFMNHYSSDKNICSYKNIVPQSSTMIFNGQAVKMSRWCEQFSNTKKYYYMYTPQTQKGEDYIFNLFRTAVTPVQVQLNSDKLPLPVIGFTKAWNTAGGDAI